MLWEIIAYLPYGLLFIGVWLVLFGIAMRYNAGSSNGRTSDSGSENRGSNPRPAAKDEDE